MYRNTLRATVIVVAAGWLSLGWVSVSHADVLNMGAGLTSLEFVPVGNTGNTADSRTGIGAVSYSYNMGKYEVTIAQYVEFLNAVASTDTYGLYDDGGMVGITRSGSSGSYSYATTEADGNKPVANVGVGDAFRFSNWLTNGQPTGAQGDATTEDGSYDLNGAVSDTDLAAVTRNAVSGEMYFLSTQDEWYKAAFHQNDGDTGNYYDYPTSTSTAPGNDLSDPDGGNNANYSNSGSVTEVVGGCENSDSPYGTFDQGGNVFEWTSEVTGTSFEYRGGGYNQDVTYCKYDWTSTLGGTGEYAMLGFRVTMVPEPASLLVLGAGAVWTLAIRRRRR